MGPRNVTLVLLTVILVSFTILNSSGSGTQVNWIQVSSGKNHDASTDNLTPDPPSTAKNQVTIEVDFSKPVGRTRSLQQVHCGPIPRQKGAAQLHQQYMQIGVDCIRPMSAGPCFDIDLIFPNLQADPSIESNYNFTATDTHVQAIRSVGAEVFYRLGYSWEPTSERAPRDYAKFAEICKRVVMHYNQGWANGFNYGIRYWEVWNEPDLRIFWSGTPTEYFRLYDGVARTLKTVDSNVRVGGPALSGGPVFTNQGFLESFLQFCKVNESPLDFVSWHIYPEREGPQLVSERAYQVQLSLKKFGFDGVENILGEWNIYPFGMENLPEARPLYWNARGAAWTTSALVYLQNTPVTKAFWYRGDSDGGWPFGLFYDNGTFKKNGYAYLAMKKLLETPVRLACNGSNNAGFAALAGKSGDGDAVRVLISDFDADCDQFTLVLRNHTWQGRTVRYEVYLLDDANNLALVEKSEQPSSTSITISRRISASSMYLIILAAEKATMETSARSAVATTAPKTETSVGPVFTQIFLPVFVVGAIVALTALVVLRRGRKTILGQ